MSFCGKIKNRYERIGGKDMEEKLSQITEEELRQMSIEQIMETITNRQYFLKFFPYLKQNS